MIVDRRGGKNEYLLNDALGRGYIPGTYLVSQYLKEEFPNLAIREVAISSSLSPYKFLQSEDCAIFEEPFFHVEWVSKIDRSGGEGVIRTPRNGFFRFRWRGNEMKLLLMDWDRGDQSGFILSETEDIADLFLDCVYKSGGHTSESVLMFDSGEWISDKKLYESIQSTREDELILEDSLYPTIRSNIERFFNSRLIYEQYGIGWKRGLIFVGPPGNGKTYCIKTLIKASPQIPCLYVKSFTQAETPDEYSIGDIFSKARFSAPCILILEDLDSLVTINNRSYFLNEIDGLRENNGILTIATTNHLNKLDPALSNRPSRFDRKFMFPPPTALGRKAYIRRWSEKLPTPLTNIDAVVEQTEGFSFAYLQELFVSTIITLMNTEKSLEEIILDQTRQLKDQEQIDTPLRNEVIKGRRLRRTFRE